MRQVRCIPLDQIAREDLGGYKGETLKYDFINQEVCTGNDVRTGSECSVESPLRHRQRDKQVDKGRDKYIVKERDKESEENKISAQTGPGSFVFTRQSVLQALDRESSCSSSAHQGGFKLEYDLEKKKKSMPQRARAVGVGVRGGLFQASNAVVPINGSSKGSSRESSRESSDRSSVNTMTDTATALFKRKSPSNPALCLYTNDSSGSDRAPIGVIVKRGGQDYQQHNEMKSKSSINSDSNSNSNSNSHSYSRSHSHSQSTSNSRRQTGEYFPSVSGPYDRSRGKRGSGRGGGSGRERGDGRGRGSGSESGSGSGRERRSEGEGGTGSGSAHRSVKSYSFRPQGIWSFLGRYSWSQEKDREKEKHRDPDWERDRERDRDRGGDKVGLLEGIDESSYSDSDSDSDSESDSESESESDFDAVSGSETESFERILYTSDLHRLNTQRNGNGNLSAFETVANTPVSTGEKKPDWTGSDTGGAVQRRWTSPEKRYGSDAEVESSEMKSSLQGKQRGTGTGTGTDKSKSENRSRSRERMQCRNRPDSTVKHENGTVEEEHTARIHSKVSKAFNKWGGVISTTEVAIEEEKETDRETVGVTEGVTEGEWSCTSLDLSDMEQYSMSISPDSERRKQLPHAVFAM